MATVQFLNRIVADNIDINISAHIQTKDHVNYSLHWTHQYAVVGKVATPSLESTKPQKRLADLEYLDLLPDAAVQKNLVWQWAVLVSRVVTQYLPAFKVYRKNVMAKKSETVSHNLYIKINCAPLTQQQFYCKTY